MGELHGPQPLAQGCEGQVGVGADYQVIEGAAVEAYRLALEYPGNLQLAKLGMQGIEAGPDVVLPLDIGTQADVDVGHAALPVIWFDPRLI
ncbi:hypothetical protein D3C72_1872300 [compost metagenome]